MYEAFFGFQQRPFAAVPRPDQYYPGRTIEAARQTLARCIQRAEGPGLVLGPAGTGKTLLCQLLAEQFKDQFAVAMLSSGGLTTRRGLLQAILFALARPYRGMDEGELRLALIDYLTAGDGSPAGIVLVVDEAHTLALRLLEEIRIITNLVVAGEPCTRLVLAGAPILEERLASPRLESFSQRLAARCYLEAFNRTETQAYIEAMIQAAGGPAEPVFGSDACEAVYQATGGVPRLINQVCDHALLLASTAGFRQLAAACVREAWGDLQQLPARHDEPESGRPAASEVIEFGSLDDEPGLAAVAVAQAEDDETPLCVTRGSDDPLPEPIERIERIERALNSLEDDFQPAGSIGPEVEIVLDEPNLFAEEFQEEEVIVDRYAPIGSQSVPPKAPSGGQPPDESLRKVQQAVVSQNVFCTPMPDFQAATQAVAASGGVLPPPRPSTRRWAPEPETLPLRRRDAEAAADDSDMILVEDGYEDLDPPHVRPVGSVRKQEYRQLFARLRSS